MREVITSISERENKLDLETGAVRLGSDRARDIPSRSGEGRRLSAGRLEQKYV